MAPISPSERDRRLLRRALKNSTPTAPQAGYGRNSHHDVSPPLATGKADLTTEAKPDDRAPSE